MVGSRWMRLEVFRENAANWVKSRCLGNCRTHHLSHWYTSMQTYTFSADALKTIVQMYWSGPVLVYWDRKWDVLKGYLGIACACARVYSTHKTYKVVVSNRRNISACIDKGIAYRAVFCMICIDGSFKYYLSIIYLLETCVAIITSNVERLQVCIMFTKSTIYSSFQLSLDKSRLAQFKIWNIVLQ